MSASPMETLVENLKVAFDKPNCDPEEIKGLMSAYIKAGHTDYKQFMFFNPHKYARNLVEMNKDFELIVLCWEKHQESPIHNHSGQNCWMAVLEGPMKEVYYHATPDTEDKVQLTEGAAQIYETGQVAYIADEIALHKVSPAGEGRGATLHLYSKPIPGCQIYDAETGKITKRIMGFYSKKGKKLDCSESSCQIYRDLAKVLPATACDKSYMRLLSDACGGQVAQPEKSAVGAN